MGAKGRRHYPWREIVTELRARPGRWRLLSPMVGVPLSVLERVRQRRVRALRMSDGKVEARAGVSTYTSEGQWIADIWLRFQPTPPGKEDE